MPEVGLKVPSVAAGLVEADGEVAKGPRPKVCCGSAEESWLPDCLRPSAMVTERQRCVLYSVVGRNEWSMRVMVRRKAGY